MKKHYAQCVKCGDEHAQITIDLPEGDVCAICVIEEIKKLRLGNDNTIKTVEVKDCGYCPFRCTGECYDDDDCCNIDPGPPPYHRGKWSGIQCSNRKLPDDCPLLNETIHVKAIRKIKTTK